MENKSLILVTKNFVRAAVLCVYMDRVRFAMAIRGEWKYRGNLLYLSFHRCKRTTFFGRSARDLLLDRNLFVLCKIVIENFYQPCAIMERKKKEGTAVCPLLETGRMQFNQESEQKIVGVSDPFTTFTTFTVSVKMSTIQLGSNAETLKRENLKNYLDPRQARHSKDQSQ